MVSLEGVDRGFGGCWKSRSRALALEFGFTLESGISGCPKRKGISDDRAGFFPRQRQRQRIA